MDLNFERGTAENPKGHALVYFRNRYNQDEVLATYIVTLPIKVDVSKYIPPLFAPQMQAMASQEISGFAFPPVPERAEGLAQLRRLAEKRDDDLIDGGTGGSSDPMELLQVVNEMQEEYVRLWHRSLEVAVPAEVPSVNEVLYELLGERDRLSELSKLVGKLRFATEGSDTRQMEEAEQEMLVLAKYLPENYWISRLIKATEMPAAMGAMLAQLYLERCYKLSEEDYLRLQEVEGEIQRMEEGLDE